MVAEIPHRAPNPCRGRFIVPIADLSAFQDIARSLCGRGPGLTPTGDDILAGWMAINWLLHGPTPALLEACQHIITIAKQQTHLLSQCWLAYAAQGCVAQPIKDLLDAMTRDDGDSEGQLASAASAVLSMGATSGYDIIQGILLGLGCVYEVYTS